MAVVMPFRAWRYNTKLAPDLSKVVVPPYDVISEKELIDMDSLSPYNFSKVILAKGPQKHHEAAQRLQDWKKSECLIHEKNPGFYFYKQEFSLDQYELFCQNIPKDSGNILCRYGFFAKVQVEDYANKVILPHEKTFSKYKQDRYELMEAAQGNMEPVFFGYDSSFMSGQEFEKTVEKSQLLYDYKDRYGVKHKLWLVDDQKLCHRIEKALLNEKMYILDGHHRYETALKFFHDHESAKTKYVLANICAFKQPGTIILPTHRLVKNILNFDKSAYLTKIKEMFDLLPVLNIEDLERKLTQTKNISFGVRFGGHKDLYFAQLKKSKGGMLDLDYLHGELLSDKNDIFYVKSIPEFQERLDQNEYQVGFLVRPSTYDDVIRKATHGEVMPHKSTFFYPKIPSGLVIHCFE